MDRTDELLRATQLFSSIDFSRSSVRSTEPSPFIVCAGRVSSYLDGNETLVRRMNKLIERKEFSNDPTAEMQEISSSFQGNMLTIQKDVSRLDKEAVIVGQGKEAVEHRKLIVQNLKKMLTNHVSAFKNAVKVHAENVEQRNKRVGGKYGQVSAVSAMNSESASKYAMFSNPSARAELPSMSRQQELRNRRGGSQLTQHQYATEPTPFSSDASGVDNNNDVPYDAPSSQRNVAPASTDSAEDAYENDKKYGKTGAPSSSGGNLRGTGAAGGAGSGVFNRGAAKTSGSAPNSTGSLRPVGGGFVGNSQAQSQQQVQRPASMYDRYRLQQAQQAESTVAQMGQLFSQMATLVSEQSEVIMRIEDDVEAGLVETLEAQGHLQTVHDITKGNRGLIIKIFLLLLLFIFLFLVWT
mmetsp:Transcript_1940/g.3194  ORF Transcript_1940/g.3194 Transcript_1940/m.3194 type:complete len:410 (-) Transcript_1940:27-1256(-)|eukprot:CAMPEP_0184980162 /NCGR_PEP_ID=MMETSP1098-20130426/10180_1 /TAXON_ID=89044 /ORGANISM="Spumella elongata, Strain CCAP 955/1" /LENGTH=409 /DNA_ID=CAMNT_0027503533 /DNA_START=48 /DNA_END=1277 /DNA_ORIENTATION=+